MAGSMGHCIEGDNYVGTGTLDHMGDGGEAIDELAFVLLSLTTQEQRRAASEQYYQCIQGRRPWPSWWTPEED